MLAIASLCRAFPKAPAAIWKPHPSQENFSHVNPSLGQAIMSALERNAGPLLATCLIIANVIGSGIYTTPGFLARDLGSPSPLLTIWILGALLAFARALSYSELGAMFPEAVGEYVYLR